MEKFQLEEKGGVWQQILENPKSSIELKDESHVIALGYPDVGKSSIIRALQQYGSNEPLNEQEVYLNTEGISGIDNGYINIRRIDDDDDLRAADVEAQANFWILQSPAYKEFLKTRLDPSYLNKMAILIFLDLSNPWNLMKHLSDWIEVVEEIIEALFSKLDLDTQDKLKENQSNYITSYKNMVFHEQFAKSKAFYNEEQIIKPSQNAPSDDFYNLGIPIIVVICKSDSYTSLDTGKSRDQIDVIIAHLRKTCLNHRSALIFCNTANSKTENVLVLYQYLAHRLYGFQFSLPAILEPYTAYFLPSGWDSYPDLQEFVAKTSIENFNAPYEMIISKPVSNVTMDLNETAIYDVPPIEIFLSELLKENPSSDAVQTSDFNPFDNLENQQEKLGDNKQKPVTRFKNIPNSGVNVEKKDKDSFFENLKKTKMTPPGSKREKPSVMVPKEAPPDKNDK